MSGILRNSLTRIVPVVKSNITQKATVISAPPKNHLTLADKVGLGGTMCVLVVTPMFYIIANVKNYKGETSG